MNVYAESNLVLELVLEQPQHDDCRQLLRLAEAGSITLVIPSFCLFEPFTTLHRRASDRKDLQTRLETEVKQLQRSRSFVRGSADAIIGQLVRSTDDAASRFDSVSNELLRTARLLPLTSETLTFAKEAQSSHGLLLPDAIVLASVLGDLATRPSTSASCFINRNTKDFDEREIIASLSSLNCKMLWSFENGLAYVEGELRSAPPR